MNSMMKNTVIYFIVIMISIIMATIFQINMYILVVINLMIVFLGMLLPFLYTILWETNINRIEKFLIKKQGNPQYQLVYALANRLDDQVEEAIGKLLEKYKQKHMQSIHKVMYSLYKKEILNAKQEIEFIKPVTHMNYYKAIILVEEGKLDEVRQLVEQFQTPWMKSALLSEIEKRSNNPEKARYFAKQALDHAKGLQKYILYKNYERDFPRK